MKAALALRYLLAAAGAPAADCVANLRGKTR